MDRLNPMDAKTSVSRKRSAPIPLTTSPQKQSRRNALLNAVNSIHSAAHEVPGGKSPESEWKAKRQFILESISKLQRDKKAETAQKRDETPKSNLEKKMNVQLMKGELPQVYVDLLTRFTVVDIFLKRNHPKMVLLSNIHNYLLLSDCKLSFLEDHVRSIVYLFAYKETEVDRMEAYRMGRTKPKLATELSILTLRLPHVEKPSSIQDQLINFLGSSRNLNGVFVAMKEEGRKTELLKDRSSQLKKHICSYIDDRYEEYITRIGEKKPMEGRAAGFTMNEL